MERGTGFQPVRHSLEGCATSGDRMNYAFYIAAAVAVASTAMVITRKHVVHSLLYLICGLTGIVSNLCDSLCRINLSASTYDGSIGYSPKTKFFRHFALCSVLRCIIY